MENHATIIGRIHRLRQQNSHDFAISGSHRPDTAFGLVLDGCGSKYNRQPSSNEVGAKLLGQFAAGWLNERLKMSKEQIDVDGLLVGFSNSCLDFLRQTTALLPFADEAARTLFVMTHWLATIVGFVVTETTAVFFWQGDGYLCINGETITLDSDNQPDYLAYRLLETSEEVDGFGDENGRFQTKMIDPTTLSWLAVATDGWQPDLLAQLAEPRPNLHLQRWLNIQAWQPGNFEDDGAVAVWWNNDD